MEIAIVVGQSEPEMRADAAKAGLRIIESSVQPFDGIETFTSFQLTNLGKIEGDASGVIALARFD